MAKKEENFLQTEFIRWLKTEYPGAIGQSNLAGIFLHPALRNNASDLQTHTKQADIVVFKMRGGYGGFIFELKRNHGEFLYKNGSGFKPGPKNHIWGQVANLWYLANEGYYTDIGTLEQAKNSFKWYMSLPEFFTIRIESLIPRYPHRNLDKYGEGHR